MTAQKLNFSQGQKLAQRIYPGYLLSQKLLEMQSIELEEEIKKQLEENPVLEAEYPKNTKTTRFITSVTFADNDPSTEYLINRKTDYSQSLSEQLHQEELDEKEIIIGEEIIGSLDKDGYLRRTDNELAKSIKEKYDFIPQQGEIQKVRNVIMHLEPSGMASRNLTECLIAQLEDLEEDKYIRDKAIEIIKHHIDDLTHKRYQKIIAKTKITTEDLAKILDILHRLDPHPGYSVQASDYIVPDIVVENENGKLKAELIGEESTKLKINSMYQDIINSENTGTKLKDFIKTKIESANNFISALNKRNQNLKKIVNYILDKQEKFFRTNGAILKPMLEKDMAEDLGIEPSIISRAVNRKYMQTPFGIFELKSFFSYPLKNSWGEDISNELVKQKIREIIDAEDKLAPVTDEKISEILHQEGYPVARRTVAKYREAMKIPKATLRKQISL